MRDSLLGPTKMTAWALTQQQKKSEREYAAWPIPAGALLLAGQLRHVLAICRIHLDGKRKKLKKTPGSSLWAQTPPRPGVELRFLSKNTRDFAEKNRTLPPPVVARLPLRALLVFRKDRRATRSGRTRCRGSAVFCTGGFQRGRMRSDDIDARRRFVTVRSEDTVEPLVAAVAELVLLGVALATQPAGPKGAG